MLAALERRLDSQRPTEQGATVANADISPHSETTPYRTRFYWTKEGRTTKRTPHAKPNPPCYSWDKSLSQEQHGGFGGCDEALLKPISS